MCLVHITHLVAAAVRAETVNNVEKKANRYSYVYRVLLDDVVYGQAMIERQRIKPTAKKVEENKFKMAAAMNSIKRLIYTHQHIHGTIILFLFFPWTRT